MEVEAPRSSTPPRRRPPPLPTKAEVKTLKKQHKKAPPPLDDLARQAFKEVDTDGSGVIEIEEWEEAIEKALQVRLAQIAEERARKRAEARKARDKLAAEVLVLARQVFAMGRSIGTGPATHLAAHR